MNRLRVGCSITILIGAMYAAASLFDSLASFALGVIVASAGIIGYGLIDYCDYHRSERLRQYRAEVWHRRDTETLRETQLPPGIYTRRRDGLAS